MKKHVINRRVRRAIGSSRYQRKHLWFWKCMPAEAGIFQHGLEVESFVEKLGATHSTFEIAGILTSRS